MKRTSLVLTVLAAASGCASDDFQRIDGVTPGAGNAIAANTAMQMVDPWQPGVDETRLRVPADRSAFASETAESATSPGAATGIATTGK